jgi:ACS family hexuronate transporter-like MFS transporter
MLVCALLTVTPIVFVARGRDLWSAVALVSLAAAASGWSANLFTLVSDTFPRRRGRSVVGIGGMGGAVGGMLITRRSGIHLQLTGSYLSVFIVAGSVSRGAAILRRDAR